MAVVKNYFYAKIKNKMEKTLFQIEIINKIRLLRSERKISQKRVGEILGISDGQVGNIESFKFPHKYTLKQLYELCKEFNYPIEHLFLDEDDFSGETEIINLLIQKIISYGE